jgi:hypothetical protein
MIAISLDDPDDWPSQFIGRFEANENLLRDYNAYEQKLLDDRAWGDSYVPMALRRPNPFYQRHEEFLNELRTEYADKVALRAFHCTRLTNEEVSIVRRRGMTPPSLTMLQSRIKRIEEAGLISSEIADRLIRKNSADCPTRAGRIWFIFTVGPLKSCTGVSDLFRYWGGEALYGQHDSDPDVGPVLASIGRARIVEAMIPLQQTASFPAKQMVNEFLSSRGVHASDRDYVDRTTSPVPAPRIKRILSRSDKGFVTLTECAKWRPPIV